MTRPPPFVRFGDHVLQFHQSEQETRRALDGKLVIITMIEPMRPGAMLFALLLEHRYYDPLIDQARNDQFTVLLRTWEEMVFQILAVPPADKALADVVAREVALKLVPGVPTLLPAPGRMVVALTTSRAGGPVRQQYRDELRLFPYDRPGMFTLESCPGREPIADERERVGQLLDALKYRPKARN